eukprot:1650324-Pyramimonas_sp.AAC.1
MPPPRHADTCRGDSASARPARNGGARDWSWTITQLPLNYVEPKSSEPRGRRSGGGSCEELDLNAPYL